MKWIYTDGTHKDFVELCSMLDQYLNDIVGGEKQREQYNCYNTLENIHDVVLIYMDDIPVACASFKAIDEHTAEVKRVFVRKEYRGQGLSKKLMALLEEKAKSKGYTRLILETGALLVEALGLYHRLNYHRIENYGPYNDMKESVCMEKRIG